MSEADVRGGFKIVFVGNSGVGKTSTIERFCSGRCPESPAKSLCSRFYQCSVEPVGSLETVDLMVWDTPGRENLHLLAADSFASADICAVFYSITDRASLEAVPQWVEKVKTIASGVQVVLVENKIDALASGQVAVNEAQRMASQLDAPLFRLSAREGLNLKPFFNYLAQTLLQRYLSSLNSLPIGSDAFFVANIDDQTDGADPLHPTIAVSQNPDGAYCSVQ
jgi:small GTP-binding protein